MRFSPRPTPTRLATVQTRSTAQPEAALVRLLRAVEAGEESVIPRGPKWVARLLPVPTPPAGCRPRVGELITAPFQVPAEALAPLGDDELKQWGQ